MQNDLSLSIFPILGYHDLKQRYDIVGTGFFINNKGCFVTAAHTLKSTHLQYYALIDNCGYSLAPLFFEYVGIDDQKPPLHRDLYIGKIADHKSPNYINFKQSVSLKANDHLELSGFASKEYIDIVPGITHADQLFEVNEENAHNELEPMPDFASLGDYTEKDPCSLALTDANLLKYSTITASFINLTFEGLFEKTEVEGTFTNGFSIRLTTPTLEPAGLSGCPVMNNGLSVGIFIAAKGAISSEYIQAKLIEYELL